MITNSYVVTLKTSNKPVQISNVVEVISNSLVNMLVPSHLIEDCVLFLRYQRLSGKWDSETEQMLIDKVNEALVEAY